MKDWITFAEGDGTSWQSCRRCNATIPASQEPFCACDNDDLHDGIGSDEYFDMGGYGA